MAKDLFGNEVDLDAMWNATMTPQGKTRSKPRLRGHAAPPGTGPAGETCGTCKHRVRTAGAARTYQKCQLRSSTWTHGPGSDIRAKDAACKFWEREEGNG